MTYKLINLIHYIDRHFLYLIFLIHKLDIVAIKFFILIARICVLKLIHNVLFSNEFGLILQLRDKKPSPYIVWCSTSLYPVVLLENPAIASSSVGIFLQVAST